MSPAGHAASDERRAYWQDLERLSRWILDTNPVPPDRVFPCKKHDASQKVSA